jgi:hypothetical protein
VERRKRNWEVINKMMKKLVVFLEFKVVVVILEEVEVLVLELEEELLQNKLKL